MASSAPAGVAWRREEKRRPSHLGFRSSSEASVSPALAETPTPRAKQQRGCGLHNGR